MVLLNVFFAVSAIQHLVRLKIIEEVCLLSVDVRFQLMPLMASRESNANCCLVLAAEDCSVKSQKVEFDMSLI